MIKKLKLMQQSGIYEDKAPFIIAKNEKLEIEIEHKEHLNGCELFAFLKNGEAFETILITENKIEIPKSFIKVGNICGKIAIHYQGEEIKSFSLEKLIIKEINKEIQVFSELEELKQQFNELKNECKLYKSAFEKTNKILLEIYGIKIKVGE